jgi:hypothetical protein
MSWEEVLKNDNEEIVPHKGIPTNQHFGTWGGLTI